MVLRDPCERTFDSQWVTTHRLRTSVLPTCVITVSLMVSSSQEAKVGFEPSHAFVTASCLGVPFSQGFLYHSCPALLSIHF